MFAPLISKVCFSWRYQMQHHMGKLLGCIRHTLHTHPTTSRTHSPCKTLSGAMLYLTHRAKARYEHAACSIQTAAAAGMQAVELTTAKSTAASHRKRFSMYTRLRCSAFDGGSRRDLLMQLLAQAMLLSARCCFAATAITLLYWLLFAGPLHFRIDTGYSYSKPLTAVYQSRIVGNTLLRDLLFLWLVPAAMALSAVSVLVLQPVFKQRTKSASNASAGRLSRWLARLVPPRPLWQWLCGGLTLQDLLIIFLWAAINLSWLTAAFAHYQRKAALKAVANGLTSASARQAAKALARSFGAALAPNLVLLFYPVSRGSVVLQMLGIPYPAGIRYHRWLGYGVLTLVALHGTTYHTVWLIGGEWTAKALEQGSGHNNLLGSLAFLFALALWITSIETVRHSNYAIFKAVHHIGFWGFLILGVCHKWDLIWAFVPGLVLYGIDAVYRIHQAVHDSATSSTHSITADSCAPRVLHASVSPYGGLCTLVLSSPTFAAATNGYVWLAVPEVSLWQYHPFEYIAVPWPPNTTEDDELTETSMLLHIKAYSRWTKQLMSLIASKGEKISVKMQGPYCEVPGPVLGHRELLPVQMNPTTNEIIIIAGGNGISSAAGVFMELAAAAAAAAPGLPCLLVWASRAAEEFELLGPMVFAMAQSLQLQLTTKLYFTGSTPCSSDSTALQFRQDSSVMQDTHLTSDMADMHICLLNHSDTAKSTECTAAAAATENVGRFSSSGSSSSSSSRDCGLVTSSLCPVVAFSSWWAQAGHMFAMHAVVFTGAFCALALGQHIQESQTALLGSRWPTAKAGATYTFLLVTIVLGSGMLTLWVSLLLLKSQHKAQVSRKHLGFHAHADAHEPESAGLLDARKAGVGSGKGMRQGRSAAAVAAAAAAASVSGTKGKLVAAAAGGLQLHLPPLAPQHLKQGVSAPAAGSTVPVADNSIVCSAVEGTAAAAAAEEAAQLLQPAESAQLGSTVAQRIQVELGRPQLKPLVKAWLATQQQQLGAGCRNNSGRGSAVDGGCGRSKQCYTVYGMGPEQLVLIVQRLCDDVGGLHFVRKAHQL